MRSVLRGMVRRVLAEGQAAPPPVARAEKAEPYRDDILALSKACKGNLVRVHEELIARGASVLSYQALTAFCRKHGIGHTPPAPAGSYALPRTLDEYVAEATARRLEQTLGHVRATPRDLTQYDRLPLTARARTQEPTPCPSEVVPPDPSHQTVSEPTTTPSSPGSGDTSTSSD